MADAISLFKRHWHKYLDEENIDLPDITPEMKAIIYGQCIVAESISHMKDEICLRIDFYFTRKGES